MKNPVSIIALFALFIVSTSANSQREVQAAKGCIAPPIELSIDNSDHPTAVSFQGQWTLINFWDSCDPVSRIAAVDYDSLTDKLPETAHFRLLSVNLDKSREVYEEIAETDNLSEGTQIHVNLTDNRRLESDYHLAATRNAYLVNPEGIIVAVNPSASEVKHLMSI